MHIFYDISIRKSYRGIVFFYIAMQNKKRFIEDRIVQSLKAFPVVYIAGPRQSGKTTLAQRIAADRHKASYITFDDIQTRSAVQRDPEAFLRSLHDPVVLNEIQMVPEIFRPLKIIVDENRQKEDGGRGRFLLTGSASVMALPKLSDALVGRMALHTLLPFSAGEIKKNKEHDFIYRAFSTDWFFQQRTEKDTDQMLLKASFPELLFLEDPELHYEWCNGYLNTILQRDVRVLLEIDKMASLPDMLRLLASRTGGVLNEASLSRTINLNHVTAKKYRILLENLFLLLSVSAWSVNLGKRVVKSPKVYLSDLNLLSYLLNIRLDETPRQNPILFGKLLENFVAVELTKQLTFSSIRARLYHYRTSTGQEVDFLLEGPQGMIVGIEIKSTSKVSAKDFRHLETLKNDLGDQFQRGFVLYQGTDVVPFGDKLIAAPLNVLWQ